MKTLDIRQSSPVDTKSPNPATKALGLEPKLFLSKPPPPDSAWLAHEKEAKILSPSKVADVKAYQSIYSQVCKDRNALLLSSRDQHLTQGLKIHNTQIVALDGYPIPIRSYNPVGLENGPPLPSEADAGTPVVIYFHGGGLRVGDLDSEDLSCRRICKELRCTVYSVDYRLMPDYTADRSIKDAYEAVQGINAIRKASRLILIGSSSGGQLAAQISQMYGRTWPRFGSCMIHGVLLRCPVTCDATQGGINIPEKWRDLHKSMDPAFYTSIQAAPALDASTRAKEHLLPLEAADFSALPRAFIQVTTNDVYYSDGICYAAALMEAGVEVKLDVVEGWPHTFWLKAPLLDRAVKAEKDMIEGLRWLFEAEITKEEVKKEMAQPDAFVPLDTMEFERKFDQM